MTASGRRLLFIGAHPKANGSNVAASHEVALRLSALGWQTTVVSMHHHPVGRLAEQVRAAARAPRSDTIVLLDVFSGRALLWARLVASICRARGLPYVAVLHGGGLADVAARSPGSLDSLLGGARAIVAPSPWLAREVARSYASSVVIPNAIELKAYPWRERRTIAPEIIWLRALHPIYRPELAIQTVAILRNAGVPARLTVVGPDKAQLLSTLMRMVRESKLEPFVRFVGPAPKQEVPQWLDRADILLNTTDVDNAPVSLIEAMACGLPVVSTNVGGVPDLIGGNAKAVLVPPGSAEEMAGAILALHKNPDRVAELSNVGRLHAARHDRQTIDSHWATLLSTVGNGN